MTETYPGGTEEHEQEQHGQRIYLEVGPWHTPTAATSTREYSGDNVYIGMELNQGDYHDPDMFDMQRQYVGDRLESENIILTQGDGRNTVLPEGTVHEVYMGNVLPAVEEEDIEKLLTEAHRIMDGTGPLIIDAGDTSEEYFVEDVQDVLATTGFNVTEVLREDGEDPERWREIRDTWPSPWPSDHVYIIANKQMEAQQ